MEAIQAVATATEIVSGMISAIAAFEKASRDLEEAPNRIQRLEQFVRDLERVTRGVKHKHVHKLHNPKLENQITSLNTLINRLHPKLTKARSVLSKSKVKMFAKTVWSSMTGDPLGKIATSMKNDLTSWLEHQKIAEDVEKAIETTANSVASQLKVKIEQGYPVSSKCGFVRDLLERNDSHRVVLIVGLSGIGKSCLVRQVASDPPGRFEDGAVELGFGQWCSRAACNGNRDEYQKRLARKLSKLLVLIGFQKTIKDDRGSGADLEQICLLLQEALLGKRILVVLDDVWEQDIVERFAKLYDNDCKYVVTTRNEAVYEITEAEKVELNKDDIKEISKAVLLYHCLLSEEELPDVAESLLERCGHHPLTVAVMGKALRKETRAEKWEKAITNLSTFANCAPGPLSYVNEKEAENTLTIFGSFEFSLDAMPQNSRKLFTALAALSWGEPVPEACVEAVWSVIGHESLFSLIVSKLYEGSLLIKTETDPLYSVHDMVALYLDSKTSESVEILLEKSRLEDTANLCPWLIIFGKESVKRACEQRLVNFLSAEEKHTIISLKAVTQALMASKSISELETSRASFSRILGPKIASVVTSGSEVLITVLAEAITNVFSKSDYCNFFPFLVATNVVERLASTIEAFDDSTIQTNISMVLAQLAEFGNSDMVDKVLQSIPFDQLGDLLSPDAQEWHESVFTILMSLIRAGKSRAVERMLTFEMDKTLLKLLKEGPETAQHEAVVMLKSFQELGGGSLRPTNLNLLPWHVRLRLESFASSDRNVSFSPKHESFEELVGKMMDGNNKQVLQAMQELIPIVEKAKEPGIREMILKSFLFEQIAMLLKPGRLDGNSTRSFSAFLLMKLACSGGEPCIKKFIEHDIIPELVKMMQSGTVELMDAAYTALHQILFCTGGAIVLRQILQMGLVERMVQSLESKSAKMREVNGQCLLDIVELGNKACLEKMLALKVVEKLVKLERSDTGTGKFVVGLLKGMDRCKHLSVAERRVMKLQVARQVRPVVKGYKFERQILDDVHACVAEKPKTGSNSGSSGKHKR